MDQDIVKPSQPQTVTPGAPESPDPTPKPALEPPTKPVKSKKLRLIIIASAAMVVLLGGAAAANFGLILPNRPENVWKKALENTAQGYDRLVEYEEALKDRDGAKLDGTYRLESDDLVLDGSFDSRIKGNESITRIDAGAAGSRITLDLLTTETAQSQIPDIYVKASDLKSLAGLLGLPSAEADEFLSPIENKWFVIDHTLLEQTIKEEGIKIEDTTLTNEDMIAIEKAVGRVNREYLFTTDNTKAVLKNKEFAGKVTIDEREQYHYKVSVDKSNLRAYLNALKDELNQTKLPKYLGKDKLDDLSYYQDLLKAVDGLEGSETVDVWVDLSTRLIRTVRITDKDNAKNYLDIGQKYTGGDSYPFYLALNVDDDSGKFTGQFDFVLNTAEETETIGLDLAMTGESSFKVELDGVARYSDEDVNVQVPAGARSITELFGDFFGGLLGGFDSEPFIPAGVIEFET